MILRESDIRSEKLIEGQQKAFKKDIVWLQQNVYRFVITGCPACDNNISDFKFTKYEMLYVECPTCRTVYMNPRPSEALLREYYKRSENYTYWANVVFPASEEIRKNKIFAPRLARLLGICSKYAIPRHTLLEVGSGFGTFAELATKEFKKVIAMEPTPELANICRDRGLHVIEDFLENTQIDSVNIITSFEVIEHLFSPRYFIQYCYDMLEPKGLVILTCPNIWGFDIALLGPISSAIDVEHLNYFNPESLIMLFESVGFEVLEVTTPGQLDVELVRKAVIRGEFKPPEFLKNILMANGDEFQKILSAEGLSSHMWIVGRKNEVYRRVKRQT